MQTGQVIGTGLRVGRWASACELALAVVALLLFVSFVARRGIVVVVALGLGLLVLRWLVSRRETEAARGLRPGRWLAGFHPAGFIPILAVAALLPLADESSNPLAADGPLLYAQLRSAVLDGDLDFCNEFESIVPSTYQHWAEEAKRLGRSPDPNVEPGPALLWSPFFLAAHAIVRTANLVGMDAPPANGYSPPYLRAVAFAALFWAAVGVFLVWLCLRRYFDEWIAAVTTATLALSSPVVWYATVESGMPHSTAWFAGALLLWAVLRARERPSAISRWALAAAAGMLGVIINRSNIALLLLPLLFGLQALWVLRRSIDRRMVRRSLWGGLAVLGVSVLVALPYVLLNLAAREASVLRVQGLFGFTLANWSKPAVVELLFSTRNGLIPWTPIALVGIVGLLLFFRRQPALTAMLLVTLAFSTWIQAASYDWTGGWSFGARRFTGAMPLLAMGIATVVLACLKRPWILVASGLALLVGFNLSLVGQVADGRLPRGEAVSFYEATVNAVHDVYRRIGFPPTLPATAALSWRYGVPPGRFDRILGAEPLDGRTIEIGTPADDVIRGSKWTVPHRHEETFYRWAIGPESTLLLALDRPCDRTLSMRVGSAGEEGVWQSVSVQVNGEPVGGWRFGPAWSDLDVKVSAAVFVVGINEVTLTGAWTRMLEIGPLVRSAAAGKPAPYRLASVAISRCETH